MAYISVSKPYQWSPRVFPTIPRTLNPSSTFNLLRFFTTTDDSASSVDQNPNPVPGPEAPRPENPNPENVEPRVIQRTPRGNFRNPEKIEDVICRMMASRAWTTRLQNSIRALVPEFDNSLVWNVLHSAKNSEHALQFFSSTMLGAYCLICWKKGVEWDEELFVLTIESYGKAGIVQEAVKIFQKMKELGVERTVESYDALFKVILRRGRYMMAKRYFNAMLNEGIEPTRHTYNLMIWGFFLSLRLETAKRFYEDMKSRGISPYVVTYNTMINGYNRFKMMDEAEKLFTEMKGRNIGPTVISYTTMVKGYVSVGRVDDGLRLFDEMKSFGIKPNDVTYTTLLPGLCDAEKMPEARSILKEMVEKHIAPKDNSIFMKLLTCQCKSSNLDAATDVLMAMIWLSIPTEAGHYGVLIENFCKAEDYDQAIKPQSSLDMEPSAYNPMIQYLCKHGQTGKAEIFFRQLMKKGVLDSVAFNNLLCGHSKEGNPDSAFEILKIMDRRGVSRDADSYKLLIKSSLNKGEPADAKTTLDSMIEAGHLPDSSLFRSVMESLFEDGRVQTASRVMKSMVEKGVKENMDLVAKILEALLMGGHVEEALGRIDLLMRNGCSLDFDSLLSALCEKGKTIAALKLLDFALERDYTIDFSSYDKVLDAILAAGKTLNAYLILCKIMEKGGASDWSSCADLIKSLNQEGNTKQADILSRMITGEEKSHVSKKGKKHATVAA
ncbi:hypothetical protein ACB094_07G148400 [Castanea mollissima]